MAAYHFNPNKSATRGVVPKPCRICGDHIGYRRQRIGKATCLDCQADLDRTEPTKHLIAIPYNKGAYQYIHDPADLFGTNPKQPRE